MSRFPLIACVAALCLAALPATASACRMSPPPTPEAREAMITQRQTAAWAEASLVYLAEVVEWELVQGGPDGTSRVNLTLAPLVVLKGEGTPPALSIDFPAQDRRCGRDFLDIQDGGAGAGRRFLVYARTNAPASVADIRTQIFGEVRDPSAISALAGFGWLQPAPRPANQLGGN